MFCAIQCFLPSICWPTRSRLVSTSVPLRKAWQSACLGLLVDSNLSLEELVKKELRTDDRCGLVVCIQFKKV